MDKFVNLDGETAIRTLSKIVGAIEASFSPKGLSKELKTTTMVVTSVAGPIPATPLVDRNAISIHNKSTDVTLFIGNSDVQANTITGTFSGWEIPPQGYLNFDITDDIILYAVAPAGKNAIIKVLEVA